MAGVNVWKIENFTNVLNIEEKHNNTQQCNDSVGGQMYCWIDFAVVQQLMHINYIFHIGIAFLFSIFFCNILYKLDIKQKNIRSHLIKYGAFNVCIVVSTFSLGKIIYIVEIDFCGRSHGFYLFKTPFTPINQKAFVAKDPLLFTQFSLSLVQGKNTPFLENVRK